MKATISELISMARSAGIDKRYRTDDADIAFSAAN
jgi:hypothetical protein